MNTEKANKVYDILVELGGAREDERDSFIYSHCRNKYCCEEWRFSGHFGFGGKYRSERNSIDFYNEDTTNERIKLQEKINNELNKIR